LSDTLAVRSAVFLVSVPARAGSVTATNAMKKIRATDPVIVPGVTSINIETARNEFESFRIVIRGFASQVTAKATNFTLGSSVLTAASCASQCLGGHRARKTTRFPLLALSSTSVECEDVLIHSGMALGGLRACRRSSVG